MRTAQFMGDWLELYVDPAGLAPRTVQMYHYAAGYIVCALGDRQLDAVEAIDLVRLLRSIQREHARTAQQVRLVIVRVWRLAKALGYTALTLDADILPKVVHKAGKRKVLLPEQMAAYIKAASDDPLGALLLLLCCGLRRGEALGVMRQDISPDGVLTISRQRHRVGKSYVSAPLKSDHARRQLQLPRAVLELVQRLPVDVHGWLIDTTPEDLTRAHRRVMARIGADGVTLHGLRHSFATIAAQNCNNLKLLQLALGHASMTLTADLYADHITGPSAVCGSVFGLLSAAR